jgi:hypothetical protein
LQTLTISKLWLNVETVTLFRQQDIVGFKIIQSSYPNAFITALSITATQPTNGFVDLRKPTKFWK